VSNYKYCKTGAHFAIPLRNHFFKKGVFDVKNYFSEKSLQMNVEKNLERE
jgi:hypothetical protein